MPAAGYLLDERFTTLPESFDRIMATVVTAKWEYAVPDCDYDAVWQRAYGQIQRTFTDHYSPSEAKGQPAPDGERDLTLKQVHVTAMNLREPVAPQGALRKGGAREQRRQEQRAGDPSGKRAAAYRVRSGPTFRPWHHSALRLSWLTA